jgi:coproporphyrinogen III oxidase-like Fe-S oxidoreductase
MRYPVFWSWNCRSVKKYIENVKEGRAPIEKKEILSKEQRMMEMVYLGLRKMGIFFPFSQKTTVRFQEKGCFFWTA